MMMITKKFRWIMVALGKRGLKSKVLLFFLKKKVINEFI